MVAVEHHLGVMQRNPARWFVNEPTIVTLMAS
jgi:hypothetical protein